MLDPSQVIDPLEREADRAADIVMRKNVADCPPISGRIGGRVVMRKPADTDNGAATSKTLPKKISSYTEKTPVITKSQITRDQFLRRLAARPEEALPRWRRLRPGEQSVLVTYMAEFYGLAFAQRFMQSASARTLPESVITVTNSPELAAQILTARGYASAGSFGAIQVWVDPSGNEIWWIPQRTKPATPAAEEYPSVMEARLHADDFTMSRDSLIDRLSQLRSSIGKPEYAETYGQYWDEFNRWQTDLNEVIEKTLPALIRDLDPRAEPQFTEQSKRIEDLMKWKLEDWPKSIQGLPSPQSSGN